MSEYLVVIEHEGESWGAYCPDLPGVGVVGDSQEEVEKLIREAITFHLDGLREAGEPIPEPTAVGTTLVKYRPPDAVRAMPPTPLRQRNRCTEAQTTMGGAGLEPATPCL